jgi:hypothetical protein
MKSNCRLLPFAMLLLLGLSLFNPSRSSHAAGVTIVTHGLKGNVDDWVISMVARMTEYYRFPGTGATCYEIYFTLTNSTYVPAWRRIGGDAPPNTDSGEILIKLDWRQLANDDFSTYQIAAAVVPRLLQSDFIPEMNGHALAELPIHLIGHSRGGSLVCEMSRLLGVNGVWVDHLTTLDPHPLNNDGFFDFPYTVEDAPARTYENVLFHDNYYQTINLLFFGEPIAGAYVRRLTNLDGGYDTIAAAHSDVHLWYHGTVDLRVPADDTVATIGSTERQTWWTPSEDFGVTAGFYYSLIGGGDRLATNQPAGPGTARIRDGYNQRWNLGAGTSANRTSLSANNGNWPNLIKFALVGTNLMAQGESNAVTLHYQWARPASSTGTLGIYLDDDFNPWSGNESLVRQFNFSGNTSNNVNFGTLSINVASTNTEPGVHSIFGKLTAAGRTRYLYADELITVVSSWQRPTLAIAQQSSGVRVEINGVPGQRVILQATSDFRTWQPVATNWLDTARWTYDEGFNGNGLFYRAELR